MKTKTKYVAPDGAEFDSEAACLKYEQLLTKIAAAFKGCPKLPRDPHCNFANGGGYLQWLPEQRKKCEAALRKLMKPLLPRGMGDAETVHLSWLCRVACDNDSPLYSALLRLNNQDSKLREWGQGYYAIHPEEGKQVEYTEGKQ